MGEATECADCNDKWYWRDDIVPRKRRRKEYRYLHSPSSPADGNLETDPHDRARLNMPWLDLCL